MLPPPSLLRNGTVPMREFPQAKLATVLVDSRDRNYGRHASSSQFVVSLPGRLRNVRSALLLDAQIPSSFYVVCAARATNSMTVELDGSTNTVTVPDGNYTATQMSTALQTALNAAFGTGVFTVTFSSTTQKFTLAATGTIVVDTTGAGPYTAWGLGYFLGFPRNALHTGTDTVTGTSVANLNPESFVCVHVDELDGIEQCAMYGDGVSGRRCLAKIPITGDSFTYTMIDQNVAYSELKAQADVTQLTVALRFHDGTLVDLNGQEWSFTVQFTYTEARG
jgi:hypothetical protein